MNRQPHSASYYLWLGILMVAVCIALTNLGHAQNASVQNSQAQPLQMTEHPQHASPHPLGSEQNLLTGDILYAQGERPISEFVTELKREVPLGDVARYYRNHKYVPKEDTP